MVQQTGYQVGDFLVQVQSGTNWMVAFGQQATQLVGVLPLLSEKLGVNVNTLTRWAAGLGIIIPLVTAIGAYWLRSMQDVESGGSVAKDVLKRLQEETQKLQDQWSVLKFGSESLASIDEYKQKASALREEIVRLDNIMQSLNSSSRSRLVYAREVEDAKFALQETVDILKGLVQEENKRLAEANRLAVANSINAQMLGRQNLAYAAINAQLRAQTAYQKSLNTSAGQLQGIVNAATAATSGLAGAASAVANAFAAAVANARSLATSLSTGGSRGSGPGGPLVGSTEIEELQAGGGVFRNYVASPSGGSSGGGGSGGGNSDRQNKIDALIKELQTEEETLAIWYEESQTALRSASDVELEIIGGKNAAKLRLEQEYQDRLKEILSQETNYRLAETGNMFSSLADLAGVGGKKMLRVQATLSAAATTIAAYETAVKAAAEAKTIPGRIAAYTKFLATGLGAVKAIKSAGGIGGGAGGGSGGSPSSVTGSSNQASTPAQTVYIDSITPEALYSGQTLINLFEAFYKENDNQGKVFVVRGR